MSPSVLRILVDAFVKLTEARVIGQTCYFTCLIAGSLPFLGGAFLARDRMEPYGLGHRLDSTIGLNYVSFVCTPGILTFTCSPFGSFLLCLHA